MSYQQIGYLPDTAQCRAEERRRQSKQRFEKVSFQSRDYLPQLSIHGELVPLRGSPQVKPPLYPPKGGIVRIAYSAASGAEVLFSQGFKLLKW